MSINWSKVSSQLLILVFALAWGTLGASLGLAQATGSIRGTTLDSTGAVIPDTKVTVSNASIGVERIVRTNETGGFVVSSLLPADYDITAEKDGFTGSPKRVTLSAGNDITVDFALSIGTVAQTVDVTSQGVEVNLVNTKVEANINPTAIAELPLIGRNAYELAKMSPAVLISSAAGRNNDIAISIIGKATTSTRVTLNGLDISNVMAGGEPEMNFSNELVQEFQVSINNGDPANGQSSSGTINLVTKRGENLYHGAGYGYFRNNQYAGYPGISHPAVIPNPTSDPNIAAVNATNAEPTFFRRVLGGIVSGPVRKDHTYWLVSGEELQQQAAAVYYPNYTAFNNAFSSVGTVPSKRLTGSARLDWQADANNSFYFMWAGDRLRQITNASGMASQAAYRNNDVHFGMVGYTRIFTNNLVGDFRFGFDHYDQVTLNDQAAKDIAKQVAVGTGLDTIGSFTVSGTNMIFGGRTDSPQEWWNPRAQFAASFSYNHGPTTWKFGGLGEPTNFRWINGLYSTPMTGTIFNPTQAAAAGISIPATFKNYSDILQLPLQSFTFAVGNQITYPENWNGDKLLWTQIYSAYTGASYKATPKLTLNWNLLYSYNGGAPNPDLPLPSSLAIFTAGGKLSAPKNAKNNFSPSVGFAWDPVGQGKTVIRAGTGYYYGIISPSQEGRARPNLLPVGDGAATVAGDAIPNPKTGIGSLNFKTANANAAAGVYRLQDLVNDISTIKSNLLRTVFTGTNKDLSVRNLDYFHGESTGVYDPAFRLPTYWQSMIGIQQQFGSDWLLGASYIYNVSNHEQFQHDANLSQRAAGPIAPLLGQPNLTAPVIIVDAGARSLYKALLVDAKKSFSHRYTLNAAYTHQNAEGTAFTGQTAPSLINYLDWKDNWGPFASIPANTFSLGLSVTNLPWGFDFSFVNYFSSNLPMNAYLAGLDLTGDGTTNDHLPEIGYNRVNRGCDKSCLQAAVSDFNLKYASIPGQVRTDRLGNTINPINLPANFQTGHSLRTQDIRLTKRFRVSEGSSLAFEAEVFNLLNWANLTFATSAANLYSSGFGQPTDRSGTNFGTGGPRSMQFGARFSF